MGDDEDEVEGEFDESTNAVRQAWIRHSAGKKLDDSETLTIDNKNGFALYEDSQDDAPARTLRSTSGATGASGRRP